MHLNSSLSQIPPPAERRIAARLTKAGTRAIRAGHPWLFEKAIIDQSHSGRPGDLAVMFDRKRRFLGVGLYDPDSTIRVRVLQHGTPAPIGRPWFRHKILEAAELRRPLRAAETTGYRLLHGENDGMPGLVIDRYAGTYVVKLYTPAWVPHLREVLAALIEVTDLDRIVLRLSRVTSLRTRWLAGLLDGQLLAGTELAGPVRFLENGLEIAADVAHGQKTGFFFDQRDNRARAEKLAVGKRVLDVFAYTGGFSLYAARGGADEVISIDNSRSALAAARRNFDLNRKNVNVASSKHKTIHGDAFNVMNELIRDREGFDMIVIDPPSFARKQGQVRTALMAYGRLAKLGLTLLRPRGVLIVSSCSGQVSSNDFFERVHREAIAFGRPLREIQRTYHPLDHPISFREGAYLKSLFASAPRATG